MKTEDGRIIDKCLSGEPEAFGFLVDRYKESVYAFVYAKVGNFHDAEDLTQEVFVNAYEKLSTLRRWDSFHAWLYSIASNLCKNYWRSQSRRPNIESVEDIDEQTLETSSIFAHQAKLQYQQLYEALAELNENHRTVLTLHYLAGMKSREIAQFLGSSKNTIDQRLFVARKKLKEEMITMMSSTFDEMRLQPGFTFRVVEAIKRTKIEPVPRTTPISFGISAVTGLIVLILSLTIPQSLLYPIGQWIGSALPSQTQVKEVGVIPVDTVEVTEITILSSEIDLSDFGQKPKPDKPPIKAFGVGSWTQKADMPTAKWGLSTSVVDGTIYAIGGFRPGASTTVEAYAPANDKWTIKADMPTARFFHALAVVDGIIYAIGGAPAFGGAWVSVSTVEAYDPATNTWTKKADMPTARAGLSVGVVDGIIYAIGGTLGAPTSWAGLPTVEAYDPAANKWTTKTDMLIASNMAASGVVDGIIYVIGGDPGGGLLSTVQAYNPANDEWTIKADIPTEIAVPSAGTVNGKIYVIGGSRDPQPPYLGVATVQVYDPTADTWTAGVDLPTPRARHNTSVVNGTIYIMGGSLTFDSPPYATVEVFTPEEVAAVSPQGKLTTTWGEIKSKN